MAFPNDSVRGVGAMQAVPAGTTNGAPLASNVPSNARGIMLYLNSGDSITFTILTAAPTGAPAAGTTITITGTNTPNWFEYLSGPAMIYVISKTGNPAFRFM